jgi:two-component system phosphate regulon sensor histidine kinase PhoR
VWDTDLRKIMVRKKRLFWKLFPSYVVIIVISLVAVTWYASWSLRHFFLDQTSEDLKSRAHFFAGMVSEIIDPLDKEKVDSLCKKIGISASTRITVILPSGKVIGDTEKDPAIMDSHADRPEIIDALAGNYGESIRYSRTIEKDMMYVSIPLRKDGLIKAIIRTSVPVNPIQGAIKKIQLNIAIGGLIIAAIAAALSLLVSRRLTLPIEKIRVWADDVASGKFQAGPPSDGSEEIAALSEAINRMSIELRERINTVRRQRNEMEAVLSSMVEGVIAVDMEEHIISINRAAGDMCGCGSLNVQSRSIHEVIRNTQFHRFLKEALLSQVPIERDIVLSSGTDRFLNVHGTVLRDAEGKQIGALIVSNDVTRMRRLENIRKDFVANVSHEIKTPITAIKGFVETLQNGSVKNVDDRERFLGIIEKHTGRLEAVIEDLLSLSRIEEEDKKEEIKFSEGKIRKVLENAIRACDLNAENKKIGIELSCPEDISAKINAQLLEEAVINLLDNSIKYSDVDGTIYIEVSQGAGKIFISVRDEGQGIEKEHLPRLFERFYRVDKARSRQLGGTGLGLSIVKHIAQAHRGDVSVESAYDKGSTFTISLPKV